MKTNHDVTKTWSTISTLLHDKINPKECQVLSLDDSGFLHFFRVVSSDYGKPRKTSKALSILMGTWMIHRISIVQPNGWSVAKVTSNYHDNDDVGSDYSIMGK